mgnify:CR=1 FL=1
MSKKDKLDFAGVIMLVGFALLLAFNQVVIKITNGGFQPVFSAGIRSVLGFFVLLGWMRLTGKPIVLSRHVLRSGIGIGLLFALEFVLLFIALDLTTVSRVGIIFYTMPVWLALAGHFYLPGGRLQGASVLGLVLATAGVIWAIGNRSEGQQASWVGDLATLAAAWCLASIAWTARTAAVVAIGCLCPGAFIGVCGLWAGVARPAGDSYCRIALSIHCGCLFWVSGMVLAA